MSEFTQDNFAALIKLAEVRGWVWRESDQETNSRQTVRCIEVSGPRWVTIMGQMDDYYAHVELRISHAHGFKSEVMADTGSAEAVADNLAASLLDAVAAISPAAAARFVKIVHDASLKHG